MTDIATQLQERLKRFLGYLEADPKNYPLLTEAADICLDLADVGQARLLLERAGHINDQNPQWWYQMAILCFLEQDFESSLSYTEKILNSGEQNPQVRLQHARTLVFLGRYDQAEKFLAELNDAIENRTYCGAVGYIRTCLASSWKN